MGWPEQTLLVVGGEQGEASFESETAVQSRPFCARLGILEVFLAAAIGSHGRAVSRIVLSSDLHFREIPLGSSLETLLLSLLYVSLGHSPGILSGGAHTAYCQLCERAAVTTSARSMRTAFGAKEELRARIEMKPIMGFLNICFILALNARPPLTPRMEFYCVQVP